MSAMDSDHENKQRRSCGSDGSACSACGGSGKGPAMYNPEIDRPQRDRCYHCKGTGKTPSHWPDSPGFYWWRGAPSFRWEMMQVLAHGADETDQSSYMVHKVEAHNVCRSLQVWKERGPACGEWVKIRQPETLREIEARHLQEHVCAMNRDMMGKCFVCGSSSLLNATSP